MVGCRGRVLVEELEVLRDTPLSCPSVLLPRAERGASLEGICSCVGATGSPGLSSRRRVLPVSQPTLQTHFGSLQRPSAESGMRACRELAAPHCPPSKP